MWKIRSPWGISLPAENMLSKLPACLFIMPISNRYIYISLLLVIARLQTSKSVCLCVKLNFFSSIVLAIYAFISISLKKLLRSSAAVVLCQHLHTYILSHPFSLASDGLATSAVIISINFPAHVNSK